MLLALCFLALAPLVAASPAQAGAQPAFARLDGIVTHVADGDTLDVTADRRTYRVRLDGIDAPEAGQAFGGQARQRLRVLAFSQHATVVVTDHDRYGRTVGRVSVGGVDLSEAMVRSGLAWHYTHYSADPRLAALERQARQQRRGLWIDSRAVPPWEYRTERSSRRPATPRWSLPWPLTGRAASPGGPYHGNVSSRVYHAPGCRDYNCRHCTENFASRAAAEAAGFRPHRECVAGR